MAVQIRKVAAPWTEAEDKLLTDAVSIHRDQWKAVARAVPGRTNKACRKRWLHSLCPSVKKTPWTKEEDETLLALHAKHPGRWALIARSIPGRTDDACSKRFGESLNPILKKDEWTHHEDQLLLESAIRWDGSWTRIGKELGRSGLGCRNRWRLLQRRKDATMRPISPESGLVTPMIETVDQRGSSWASLCSSIPPFWPGPYDSISKLGSNPPPHHLQRPEFSLDQAPSLGSINSYSNLFAILASHSNTNLSGPTVHDALIEHLSLGNQSNPVTPSSSSPQTNPETEYMVGQVDPDPHPLSRKRRSVTPLQPSAKRQRQGNICSIEEQRQPNTLSSHPTDSSMLPYACGHTTCWAESSSPSTSSRPTTFPSSNLREGHLQSTHTEGHSGSRSRFKTSAELLAHFRRVHSDIPIYRTGKEHKWFRCGLGCGKSWKNINGLQYHLQVSRTHFQIALNQVKLSVDQSSTSDPNDSTKLENSTKLRVHQCPHPGCPNRYKQPGGLKYHLVHGHPSSLPLQLPELPPALVHKVAVDRDY